MCVFTSFIRDKHARKVTDPHAMCTLLSTIKSCIPVEAHKDVEHVITIDKLIIAVHQGKKRKAPGRDGICKEFFQYTWDVTKHDILKILNEMYIGGEVLHSQKTGVLVCITKKLFQNNQQTSAL
jgi:predicted transcriptional regulator